MFSGNSALEKWKQFKKENTVELTVLCQCQGNLCRSRDNARNLSQSARIPSGARPFSRMVVAMQWWGWPLLSQVVRALLVRLPLPEGPKWPLMKGTFGRGTVPGLKPIISPFPIGNKFLDELKENVCSLWTFRITDYGLFTADLWWNCSALYKPLLSFCARHPMCLLIPVPLPTSASWFHLFWPSKFLCACSSQSVVSKPVYLQFAETVTAGLA